MPKDTLIRETKSVCPECFRTLKADIIEIEGKVYMVKECQKHGRFQLLLSKHPWYYRELNDFYFSLMSKSLPQHDYIVHLTNQCNLDCPICLASSNRKTDAKYSHDSLRDFLKTRRNSKINLMGAEPTMREDLPHLIRTIKKSGNIPALHTNGIKISDFSYLDELKKAGLSEVHLQFDGFDDNVYETIRGRKLLSVKLKALENLERLKISTDLKATIVRGVNENQMAGVLDFAVKHSFIKEVFFLGCRFLGRAKELPIEQCIMPDELIDILQEQTNAKISRENVFRFQKLYYSLLDFFSVRKCFYNQHFIVTRKKEGYLPIDKTFNLQNIQVNLETYKRLKMRNEKLAFWYLLFTLPYRLIGFKGLLWIKDFFPAAFSFMHGFSLSGLSKRILLVGFISACDAHSLDYQISKNCSEGAVSAESGARDIGAIYNIHSDNSKIPVNLEEALQ